MVLHLTNSNRTFQIVYSASSVHTISLNLTKVAMAYHKAQYWTPSFHSLYHPLSSLISSLISSVSSACFHHILDLRRIRPLLDFDTARTIGTSFVHSRLDYCNSMYYCLPQRQLNLNN